MSQRGIQEHTSFKYHISSFGCVYCCVIAFSFCLISFFLFLLYTCFILMCNENVRPWTWLSPDVLVSCSPLRLTGYGIHHCFARSMMDPEAQETTMFHNFYADYYTMAGIAVASCMALCPAVGLMGRRGGLLMFMIITALASLLQLGLLNRE